MNFDDYLASLICAASVPCHCWDCSAGKSSPCPGKTCGARASHSQDGNLVCNQHTDNSPNAPRSFATNE